MYPGLQGAPSLAFTVITGILRDSSVRVRVRVRMYSPLVLLHVLVHAYLSILLHITQQPQLIPETPSQPIHQQAGHPHIRVSDGLGTGHVGIGLPALEDPGVGTAAGSDVAVKVFKRVGDG